MVTTWLAEARAGHFRLILVSGPAGVGKTALVARALERVPSSTTRMTIACREDGLDQPVPPADAVLEAGSAGPVVVWIEDLHWAPEPVLDLIRDVVTAAALLPPTEAFPVGVVLTARRPLADSAPAALLSSLAAERASRPLGLEGLDELHANRLVRGLASAPPTPQLLAEVVERSDGNPLLIRLLVAQMLRDRSVVVDDGRLVARKTPRAFVPVDLDTALTQWIDSLDPHARTLLTAAAVLGDGGFVRHLGPTSGMGADDVGIGLDRLESGGFLRVDDGQFHFGHPQLRTVVVDAASPERREELHARAARALEVGEEAASAASIARHLQRAGSRVDAPSTVRWSLIAGREALRAKAWAAAAAHFEAALARDSGAADVGVLLDAATAHFRNFDRMACVARATEAVTKARAAGDLDAWCRAATLLSTPGGMYGAEAVGGKVEPTPVLDFLAGATEATAEQRAEVLANLAQTRFLTLDLAGGVKAAAEAHRLLRDSTDDALRSQVEVTNGLLRAGVLDLSRARAHVTAGVRFGRRAGDAWRVSFNLGRRALIEWLAGDLRAADRAAAASCRLVTDHRDWAEFSLGACCRAGIATAQGRFADAEVVGGDAEVAYHRTGYPWTPGILYSALAYTRATRGDLAGAREAAAAWSATGARGAWRARLLAEGIAGNVDDVRDQLVSAASRHVEDQALTMFSLTTVGSAVEFADLAGDRTRLPDLLRTLEGAWRRGARFGLGWPLSVPRLIGVGALGLGRAGDAVEWLERAVALADDAAAPAEAGRARHDLARAMLARGDGEAAALRVLQLAAAAFDEAGMVAFVQRARRMATALDPVIEPEAPMTRYLLVTDIVDSTVLNLRAGDARYVELLREHNRVVRGCVRAHGGVEFKQTGDGFCAWFPTAPSAVDCALDIQPRLDHAFVLHPMFDVRVRCGVAEGAPIGDGEDLFGLDVVVASRLCSLAPVGEVVVTEGVAAAIRPDRDVAHRRREVQLKGFSTSRTIFELVRGS